VLTRKRFAIAIGCQINDPKIDTQKALHADRCGCLNLTADEQIPLATDQRQIGFAALRRKQLALAFATDKPNRLPPAERPDRDFRPLEVVGEDPII
jgi:hypothetical protein